MKLTNRRRRLGQLGEKTAEKYLCDCGLRIIEKNFRTRYGEIDIIAKEGNELVFVEVRARSSKSFGTPEESITFKKKMKVKNMARYYCSINRLADIDYRIDVVAINFNKDGKLRRLNHIRSAF